MGTVAFFEKLFLRANTLIRKTLTCYGEHKNIHRKKRLINSVTLTSEQVNEIDAFFKCHYGKKISKSWHKLYQSYTGQYRYNYFPEILFSTKLEPKTNNYRVAELLGDKNLLHAFFGNVPGVHIPKTYLSSVNGIIRTENNRIINLETASKALKDIGSCVIKKTVDTSSGRDVQILNIINEYDQNSNQKVFDILRSFGKNYVVQEKINQSSTLSEFNSSSLNTFRVITYILNNKINTCPIALRLGRNNAEKDNIHYGGLSVGVGFDGKLKPCAFSEYGERYFEHPDSKVPFEGKEIKEIDIIIEKAKQLHECMPYLGIISWDLSLDSENMPVLIEMNTTGQSAWFCQMVNGEPLFGDNTSKILEMIR